MVLKSIIYNGKIALSFYILRGIIKICYKCHLVALKLTNKLALKDLTLSLVDRLQ